MHSQTSFRLHRAREIVFGLCAAWLVLQNMILFALLAMFPPADLGTAALILVRVALRAATPLTLVPGAGPVGVVAALLGSVTGVHHG